MRTKAQQTSSEIPLSVMLHRGTQETQGLKYTKQSKGKQETGVIDYNIRGITNDY